ncbi:helix-turn-helix domain-containing protein [Halogranum amylolyticum]|uniref:helix-turn-helix domain-containing protein n=1 Tax=Halogranum amylolyticum TaxID=660520 RepID=UPI000AD1F2D3
MWTPALVRDYIAETFSVEYSLAHMYRVMKRAGLSYQTARPRHHKADPAEQQRWRSEFKKSGRR